MAYKLAPLGELTKTQKNKVRRVIRKTMKQVPVRPLLISDKTE